MTRIFTKILNVVCQDVMNACALQPQEEADRQDVPHKLQSLMWESHKDAKLTLYGSSCNGFGLARCDLDICLTLNSSRDCKDISHVRMIKYLAKKYYKHPELDEVIAITNAKVPIVKLFDVPSGLETDISLYNRLAQQNTRLLKTYTSIDNQVRELSYTVKRFCENVRPLKRLAGKPISLCIHPHGTLLPPAAQATSHSSASGAVPRGGDKARSDNRRLECVVFLGHRPPASRVERVWPEQRVRVGAMAGHAVALHGVQLQETRGVHLSEGPLTKLQKMWNSRCIAIDDPFDLHHNLVIGVSQLMYIYIMKAFFKGKCLSGRPIEKLPLPIPCTLTIPSTRGS
ncbi:hypothetical protein HPB48_012244 [Haemaphysalis longicornis]|uniref:Poly(A) RNA polymerase mitochondrial-like central palm domain-containing protein n=1 Tax=Haemaphysalis longicornis TaxID=44386 RepID=A0A9J6G6P1_HAELO|nr:hypothetical protein HPB48_012244 [Haemaphysalis longicornis]